MGALLLLYTVYKFGANLVTLRTWHMHMHGHQGSLYKIVIQGERPKCDQILAVFGNIYATKGRQFGHTAAKPSV